MSLIYAINSEMGVTFSVADVITCHIFKANTVATTINHISIHLFDKSCQKLCFVDNQIDNHLKKPKPSKYILNK